MKPLTRFLPALGSLLALAGCSGTDILHTFVTPRSGYTVHKDIAYGAHPRQRLDVYLPADPAMSSSVIVFFYGGSWQRGNKADYLFAGQAFASRGYIAVIADYRLYPEAYFPEFLHDSALAVAWTREHITAYGGNAEAIYLAGHSAGAYNAVMLTVNEAYLKVAGGRRSWIKGVIGIAGPYDFLPFTDPKIREIFSKQEESSSQPVNLVTPGLPPMLLVTGDDDTEVYPKNSHNLAIKLRQKGNPVTERVYHGVAHIGVALALAHGFRSKAPVLNDIDAFIRLNDELENAVQKTRATR